MRLLICLTACFPIGLASCADKPLPVNQKTLGKSDNADAKTGKTRLPLTTDDSEKTKTDQKTASANTPPADPKPRYLPRKDFEQGWIKLFDDRTLFGWKANSDANWTVSDGVISADRGNAGLLLTTVPFADYELSCDYRLAKGGNSGIFLRTSFNPKDPAIDCYELNMCDSHPMFPTGSLVGRMETKETVEGEGDWKRYLVTVKGKRITARLDGRVLIDFVDNTRNFRLNGLIGLQFRQGKIEFRNVHLKPLGGTSIFSGTDLTGWKTIPGAKGKTTIEDQTIHMKGGPTFVQSKKSWGDFVLQADVRTNADRVNSGIFFRSMEGTEKQPANGYELQVHNGFKNGDRTQPDDYQTGFGTGSIFRFAKVRWVVPNDREWCTITLVASGNRFATWVNGHQVTEWADLREPNDNPRRGVRYAPGYLILQAHDATTDVSFRNLRIAPLPFADLKFPETKP